MYDEFGGTSRTLLYDPERNEFVLYDMFAESKRVNPYTYVLPQYIELIRTKLKNIFTHDINGDAITLWIKDF